MHDKLEGNGTVWYVFRKKESFEGVELVLRATGKVPATAYLSIGKDSDPNEFNYDFMISNITDDDVTLSSDSLPMMAKAKGFTIAV